MAAEASLPSLIYGHNSQLLEPEQIPLALAKLFSNVSERTDTDFSAANTFVDRVDFAIDLEGTDFAIENTLNQFKTVEIERALDMIVGKSTLYFTFGKRGLRQYRIYSKLKEVMSDPRASESAINAALGKLRFETIYKQGAIKKLVNDLTASEHDYVYVQMLSTHLFGIAVSRMWSQLGFRGLNMTSPTDSELIRASYGGLKAVKLLGYLELRKQLGPNFHREPGIAISRKTTRAYEKACREAGIRI